jgi:hypothetical protein
MPAFIDNGLQSPELEMRHSARWSCNLCDGPAERTPNIFQFDFAARNDYEGSRAIWSKYLYHNGKATPRTGALDSRDDTRRNDWSRPRSSEVRIQIALIANVLRLMRDLGVHEAA